MSTVIQWPRPVVVETSGLNTQQVAAKAGLTYRQVDHLVRCGRIPDADGISDTGIGRGREWTKAQAASVMHVARLVAAGLDIGKAATWVREQTVDGELPHVIRIGDGVEIHLRPLPAASAQVAR